MASTSTSETVIVNSVAQICFLSILILLLMLVKKVRTLVGNYSHTSMNQLERAVNSQMTHQIIIMVLRTMAATSNSKVKQKHDLIVSLAVIMYNLASCVTLSYSRTSLQRDSEKRSDSQRRSFRWERSSIRMSVIDFKL